MAYCFFYHRVEQEKPSDTSDDASQRTSVNRLFGTLVFMKQKQRFISSVLQQAHLDFHFLITTMATRFGVYIMNECVHTTDL